jgi:hypothetical protein
LGTIRRMPLACGQTFAGYTIIRLLGSGGMGEVYLALHPRLPRRDALKLLPQDWSAATNDKENGPDACQQALGAHENVIVETLTCQVPDIVANYDPVQGWTRDPGWAVPDAERIAKAMLANVKP